MSDPVQSILVVGGGTFVGVERLQQCAKGYDAAIAADSGVSALRQAGIAPLYLVGDLDSVSPEDRASVPDLKTRASTDPGTTDLEKAVLLALELGAKKIGLICASGDRIDHTMNGVSLMLRYRGRAEFIWHDAQGDATLVYAPGATISGKPGEKVSLIPAPGATAVRSSGLKYLLDGMDFLLGSRDGISNEFQVAQARINFKTGSILVYRFIQDSAAPG